MGELFLTVLNMSAVASVVIAAIILARIPLKRAPKIASYALWAVAGFRLLFPFSLESMFSLLPFTPEPIPAAAEHFTQFAPSATVLSPLAGQQSAVANTAPLYTIYDILSVVWLAGITAMLFYAVISYALLLRRKDSETTPFVYGFFKPKIHIPQGLSEDELLYVTLHERTHIARGDHIIKLLAFAALCLHWFNPFVWVAFLLMGVDMEMSCDERVLRELGGGIKKAYSMTLVRVAADRRIIGVSPLAFGEGGMKERIKNVLNFKKHSRVIIIAAFALVVVLSVGFAANRAGSEDIAENERQSLADNIDTTALFGFSEASPIQSPPLLPAEAVSPVPEPAASAEALPTWREDYADVKDLMSAFEFRNGEVSFYLPHGYPAELFNFRITAGTGDNYVTLFECYTGTLEPAVRYFIPIDMQNIDNISLSAGEPGSDKYRVHPVYSDLLTKLVKLQNSQLPEPDERDIAEACDAMLIWLERWMTPEGRAPGYLPVSSLVSIAPVDAQNETRRDYLINAMKNGSNVDAENVIVFECDIDLSQSEGSVGAVLSGENGHYKGSAIMVRDLFDGGDGSRRTGEWYLSVIGSY